MAKRLTPEHQKLLNRLKRWRDQLQVEEQKYPADAWGDHWDDGYNTRRKEDLKKLEAIIRTSE